ncbi:MAG: hypothetical protein ACREL7_18505 [Longimicrobiales bacterium]
MSVSALRLTGGLLAVLATVPLPASAQPVGPLAASTAAIVIAGPYVPVTSPTSFAATPSPCDQTPDQRIHQRRRSSRLFGWLYRAVRNVDMEKSSAPPLLFYLRSPLLAGFADEVECPPEQEQVAHEKHMLTSGAACATITVHEEKGSPRMTRVALPMLDATSPADLLEALKLKLEARQAVVLPSIDGNALLLSPNLVRDLDVQPCAHPDAGSDESHLAAFAT